MSAFELFLRAEMGPFAIALGLVAGLLLVEMASALVGFSILGSESGDAEVDLDADVNLGGDFDADLDADMDLDAAPEIDAQPDVDAASAGAATAWTASIASWLGIGQAPLMIWIAGALTGFGICGYLLQAISAGVFGGLVPASVAAALALLPGLIFGARFATLIGRIAPKFQSSALSRRHFGGRVGVIVQGAASRGRPAQARFTDQHGEIHYVLVEPMEEGVILNAGADIVILRPLAARKRSATQTVYRAILLDEDAAAAGAASSPARPV